MMGAPPGGAGGPMPGMPPMQSGGGQHMAGPPMMPPSGTGIQGPQMRSAVAQGSMNSPMPASGGQMPPGQYTNYAQQAGGQF